MKRRTAFWLVRLYPRAWRERYGVELVALLEDEPLRAWAIVDLAGAALKERLFNRSGLGGGLMETYPGSALTAIRRPSGFVPLIMSGCALALVLYFLAKVGTSSPDGGHDEGAPARIFQLLIVGQLPFFAYLGIRWLLKDWRAVLSVLALQLLAVVAAAAIPFSFHW